MMSLSPGADALDRDWVGEIEPEDGCDRLGCGGYGADADS